MEKKLFQKKKGNTLKRGQKKILPKKTKQKKQKKKEIDNFALHDRQEKLLILFYFLQYF